MPLMTNPLDVYFSNSSNPHNPTGASVATGVAAGVATVGLIAGAFYLYRWLTDRPALSEEDLERYNKLITVYKKMGYDIPSVWRLEGNKTTYCMDYGSVTHSLDETIHQLSHEHSAACLARTNILALLQRYLGSLRKRYSTVDKVMQAYDRPDGIEAMFIYETILWFQLVVPSMGELNSRTTEIFEKRIKYCQEILSKIAKNHWHNSERANFKELVERLIDDFKAYHAHLIHRIEIANFNDLINKLGDELLSFSAHSCKTLHLLISDVNQTHLNVKQFKIPYNSERKVQKLRQKTLGEWLYKTLEVAGVEDSTFEAKNTLALEDIIGHLEGEIPGDIGSQLKPGDILKDKWGHWPFVLSNLSKEGKASQFSSQLFSNTETQKNIGKRAHTYLKEIRELHRLTLQFYYVRKNLLRAATVASVFGEIWIYGDRVGKAVLDELLNSVFDVVQDYNKTFSTFWKAYFDEHYKIYAKEKREDDFTNLCHEHLNSIDQYFNNLMSETANQIEGTIIRIHEQALRLPRALEEIKKVKIELMSDLLSFLKLKNKTTSENYGIISQALEDEKQEKIIIENMPSFMARAKEILIKKIREEIDKALAYEEKSPAEREKWDKEREERIVTFAEEALNAIPVTGVEQSEPPPEQPSVNVEKDREHLRDETSELEERIKSALRTPSV